MKIKIREILKDIIYLSFIRKIIFKEFEIPYNTIYRKSETRYIYMSIRFKWLVKIINKMCNCKERYWLDAYSDMLEDNVAKWYELKIKESNVKVKYF